jgi:hypothetical protein
MRDAIVAALLVEAGLYGLQRLREVLRRLR